MAAGPAPAGNWSGTWRRTSAKCEKPGGGIHGTINMKDGMAKGPFTMENTSIGTLKGNLEAALASDNLYGEIWTEPAMIPITAKVKGDQITGTFKVDQLGEGNFTLGRTSKR